MGDTQTVVNGNSEVEPGNMTVTDAEAVGGDGGLDTTPAEEQVVHPDGGLPTVTMDDVPEEYRPLIEAKLKDLERGYNRKFEALARERKAIEAERAQFQQLQQSVAAPQQGVQPQAIEDPLENADWEYGITADGRPVTKVMYDMFRDVASALGSILGPLYSKVEQFDKQFTDKQRAEQLAALKQEYGDFDESALDEAASRYPGVPLEILAAYVLRDQVKERAAETAYRNREAKQRATLPASTAAKTEESVDTSRWTLRDFFEHARKTGGKLMK